MKHQLMSSVARLGTVRNDAPPAPKEIADLMDRLDKTFAEFRAANDERLQGVEKRFDDVVKQEEVDRINAAITEIQGEIDEALKKIARAHAGGGNDGPERDISAEALAFFCGMRETEDYPITDADVERYAAYEKVFGSYLRRGDNALRDVEIQNAMSVGSDGNEFWVPTQMASRIIMKIFETSPMRSICDVITIPTDSITWPNDTNDATSGGFVGETETRPETDTQDVGEQTIYVREQYAMPSVYQKFLDMASIDVGAWLEGKIADKMARVENTRFVSGTGVKAPRGFLDYKSAAVTTDDATRAWGVLQYVPVGAAGAFPTVSGSVASDPDALITTVAKLKPEYRAGAIWLMSRATEAAIRKLKDADGNYFTGRLTEGATGFDILGYPIVTAEDMPAIASDSYSIAFGNFRQGYQIVDGRGMRVLRDPYTTKGKVKFYTTKWTGGDVLNFDAIKLMKFASS